MKQNSKVAITGISLMQGQQDSENAFQHIIRSEFSEKFNSGTRYRYFDRMSKLSLMNVEKAITGREIKLEHTQSEKYGLILGTEYGSLDSIHSFDLGSVEKGALSVNPGLFPNTVLNSTACQVGIELSIEGPVHTIYNGFNSSLDAIGLGFNYIKSGKMSLIFAGGIDEISDLVPKIHDRNPRIGEACGFVVLEDHSAYKGNAIAEILDYSTITHPSSNSYNNPSFVVERINDFINRSDYTIDDVDTIYYASSFLSQNDICDDIHHKLTAGSNYEYNPVDWLGATGIVQTITSIQSTNKNKINLISNIDKNAISLLLIKNC